MSDIRTFLKQLCESEIYFHDTQKKEYESGVYFVAPEPCQAPETDHILLFHAEGRWCWCLPEQIQVDGFENNERVVLQYAKHLHKPNEFKSVDLASLMLELAGGGHTEAQTAKAMEMLGQFRHNSHLTNDGCCLMTYEYWRENHAD